MTILEELFQLKDEKNAEFSAKLTPTVPREKFLGVRVPDSRKLAKKIYKEGNYEEFLNTLPHEYFDEDMLHGLIISEFKDFDKCIERLEVFLPYVNNWAVCDIMSPKIFKKHKEETLVKIKEWAESDKPYTIRFGVETLMAFYLDDDFKPEYNDIPAALRSEEYYVNMMTAWYFATALAKQWDDTIPYIEEKKLDTWTHNKAIQKARESLRITPEQKEYLKTLKIK